MMVSLKNKLQDNNAECRSGHLLVTGVVAGTVETDITAVEVVTDVTELFVELSRVLTCEAFKFESQNEKCADLQADIS
jgi:hypothetical protein